MRFYVALWIISAVFLLSAFIATHSFWFFSHKTRRTTAPLNPAVPYNRTACFYGRLFVSVFAFKSELCIQNTLSKAQALRSDLQKLIIGKELYARLKAELYRRHPL